MSKLLASLMRNSFPKRPSGAPLHTLSKLYDVPVVLNPPPPILRMNIAYFAVAEGWLLLDIGWFVLFLPVCFSVYREEFLYKAWKNRKTWCLLYGWYSGINNRLFRSTELVLEKIMQNSKELVRFVIRSCPSFNNERYIRRVLREIIMSVQYTNYLKTLHFSLDDKNFESKSIDKR